MGKLPTGGLIGKTVRFVGKILACRVSVYAANAGFFVALSVFPMLLLLMGLLRYSGLEARRLTALLSGLVPEALLPAAERLIQNAWTHTSGAAVGLSAVTTLWSAGRGMYGLLAGLNAVYDVREDRGYVRTRLLSTGCTLVLLLALVLTVTARILEGDAWGPGMRWLALPVLLTLLFGTLYRVLPNRIGGFRETLPGAVLAALGWLTFSRLYSGHVARFSDYSNIYGSVYAGALGMLWMYICISILFYGGLLNRMLLQRKIRKIMSDS